MCKKAPNFDINSYHAFKARLVELYEHSPEFHSFVDMFHNSVQSGQATFDGLFGALLLAKDIFIREQELRIRDGQEIQRKDP